jgi:hypothetical protein
MRHPAFRPAAIALGLLVAGLAAGAPAARAIAVPRAPEGKPAPSPTPPSGTVLPYGTTVYFVFDDEVSSGKTAPGTTIRLHLRDPLKVNGATLAPAGTPGSLTVVTTRRSQSGDVDGAVQIHLNPLALPDGTPFPVRAFHEYLTIEMTAGQVATRDTTDTIGDIFIPYHVIYHALRKGHEMVLPVGSVLRAQTAATIDATDPAKLVISTPPPFVSTFDVPHSDLTPPPIFTPAPLLKGSPKPKPSAPPPSAPPPAAPTGSSAPSPAAS